MKPDFSYLAESLSGVASRIPINTSQGTFQGILDWLSHIPAISSLPHFRKTWMLFSTSVTRQRKTWKGKNQKKKIQRFRKTNKGKDDDCNSIDEDDVTHHPNNMTPYEIGKSSNQLQALVKHVQENTNMNAKAAEDCKGWLKTYSTPSLHRCKISDTALFQEFKMELTKAAEIPWCPP